MIRLLPLLVVLTAALTPSFASACSVARTMKRFAPDRVAFESKHSFAILLEVPAPTVKVVSLKRATSTIEGDCGSYASVTLEVTVPDGSAFEIHELGFVFRSEPGKAQDPFLAFPNFPVVSRSLEGKAARYTFLLADPPERRSKRFELTLDVTAINHGLQLSHSTAVLLSQP